MAPLDTMEILKFRFKDLKMVVTLNRVDEVKPLPLEIAQKEDINLLQEVANLLKNTLDLLEKKTMGELELLQKRHGHVESLHELLKEINQNTNSKGEVDLNNPKALELIEKAKQLGIDIKDKSGKFSFNKEQREYLIDSIQMTIDDLRVQYELQMQTVTRLTNSRYEFIQLARLIEKRLDECAKQVIRGISQ
jgi:hypothetical protein